MFQQWKEEKAQNDDDVTDDTDAGGGAGNGVGAGAGDDNKAKRWPPRLFHLLQCGSQFLIEC